MPNFEVLDSKNASPLNKIIQNTRFKKKVSLEEMKAYEEDRFLRGKQIAYLIYQYFRITQIPSDDILESLFKFRIRESEKLKTALELYDLEIHQKKIGPDYHRLETMVKRSTEQHLRMKNSGARNGNFETSAVVKNDGVKQREQRSLGDCWQWKAIGQCSKGDNYSFRHDMNKRAKSTQPNPSAGSSTEQSEKCIENQKS